jgi:rubrerythrin
MPSGLTGSWRNGGIGAIVVAAPADERATLMSDKPSYLGLLNAIAVAESRAHAYLTAWAGVTKSDEVRAVLLKVAAREGEHGMSFARRINELGYNVRVKDDGDTDKAIALVTSDCSDLEKMEALKLHRLDTGDKPDIFDDFFKDHTIDIATGALLGRYIAEERDSARVLRHCYELLKQSAGRSSSSDPAVDRLASLERKVDELCSTVGELCAAMAPATNGSKAKSRTK